jgi:hypothetical protein
VRLPVGHSQAVKKSAAKSARRGRERVTGDDASRRFLGLFL